MSEPVENMARSGTAKAHSNIALIKYWGKQDCAGNEPAVGSLSMTLDGMETRTKLIFDPALCGDELILNGKGSPDKLPRIAKAVNVLRALASTDTRCRIETENNFPTGAGLASSASGFAALAVAGNAALELGLNDKQVSMLARSFSGSAARSLFGGFAKIEYQRADGINLPFGTCFAEQIASTDHWDLGVTVGVISEQEKDMGSTDGMELSRMTSPYYEAWVKGNDADVRDAEQAVHDRDFEKLAELSEQSCLKMHALAMASNPGILYWTGATMEAIHEIRSLRTSGVPVFFTIDAGPQIKAVYTSQVKTQVEDMLSNMSGVTRLISCGLGEGAKPW